MDKKIVEDLEAYLAGQLGERARREFEERLGRNPRDREEVEQMARISGLFASGCFDPPADAAPGPSPGFDQRVLSEIEAQRQPPFWEIFFQPLVARRVVYVACGWMLVLFGASGYRAAAEPQVENIAQSVLAEPPESADYCNVRLGCDIDLNRATMLAVVMYAGEGR